MGAVGTYFSDIFESANTILSGLAVTMSHMMRRPITTQYPYHPRRKKVPVGGPETLPDRYRGFLEVDIDICTACLKCESDCPIDCINIDVEKVNLSDDPEAKPVRALVRFDIDMAKCMFCGLCQEPCPTNAIRHTKHFEASVVHLENLVARFVDPTDPKVPYKVKKGIEYDTVEHGSIAKGELVEPAWDRVPLDLPDIPRPKRTGAREPAVPFTSPFSKPLSDLAKSAAEKKDVAAIFEEAMAGTDCGDCDYPTCHEYSVALATGKCDETNRCRPGGADSAIEAEQIMLVFKGEWEKRKAEAEAKKAGAAAPPGKDGASPTG